VVVLPAAPLFGFTLTCGVLGAKAADAESATAQAKATTMRTAEPRRAGEGTRFTGGGYVEGGSAC
jgi:hypothetical protein